MIEEGTTALIRRAAFSHNLQLAKRQAPQSKIMAVIKANGYGHGLIRAATALSAADAFGVARLKEAEALRARHFTQPVVLLEGVQDGDQLRKAVALDCELVLHTTEQIRLLQQNPLERSLSVWLKIETGMHRLGISPVELDTIVAALKKMTWVSPEIKLMSHFSSADDADGTVTQQQLEGFLSATDAIGGEKSMANSAALLNHPCSHLDWVRPGIMLYGVSPFGDRTGSELGLEPVMDLVSSVIAVNLVQPGERVGYNGTWTAARESQIAVVSAGYGDGYPHQVAVGTPVVIHGRRYPLVGKVSMDMICVDVTDAKESIRVGDRVLLWGRDLPVEEIAQAANTIAYELICRVAARVAHKESDG